MVHFVLPVSYRRNPPVLYMQELLLLYQVHVLVIRPPNILNFYPFLNHKDWVSEMTIDGPTKGEAMMHAED